MTRLRGFGLRRVRGFRVLAETVAGVVVFVSVIADAVVDVVVGVLHPWLVRGAVSSTVSAGTATWVVGGRLGGGPARCVPAGARSSSVRHCAEVVEVRGHASAPYLARQMSVRDSHV